MQTSESTPRKRRTIILPFDQVKYMDVIEDSIKFRTELVPFIDKFPELFPNGIQDGYTMKEIRISKKTGIPTRRILVDGISYTIRPSFVMPYHVAFSADVKNALFLRKFNVPFWALSHTFGKDAMYWYRMEKSLGRNSIVGTTIKDPNLLPEHLAADEKHSRLQGDKIYVATTVGNNCILGASVSEDAGENGLKKGHPSILGILFKFYGKHCLIRKNEF